MHNNKSHTILVIPSLDPTEFLLGYIQSLLQFDFLQIIVVNDGSSTQYDPIFHAIAQLSRCTLLSYPLNKGKGGALKTGFAHIKSHYPQCENIITADSDGQHAIADVCKIAEQLHGEDNTLILGSRNFSLPHIPFKSRMGNRVSSLLFCGLYGKWIQDTQTGLRGFTVNLLEAMMDIPGERFEYEMQVIISCIRQKIPMKQIEIRTIYENNNEGTHFQAVKDSLRIGKVLFGNFFKFFSSSLSCAIIDVGLAWMLLEALKPHTVGQTLLRMSLATFMARSVSLLVNYFINKHFVFQDKSEQHFSFIRYISLCILIATLSTGLLYITAHGLGINERLAKILGDSVLFLLSYRLQQIWVFAKKNGEKDFGKDDRCYHKKTRETKDF